MSISVNYPFLIPGNYTFTSTDIEVSSGCRLVLQQGNIDFTEDFLTSTGLILDSQKAEWVGNPDYLVRQIDTADGAISGATYDSSINMEGWSGGTVTGTATGGAAVSGGKLDLTYSDVRYVDYDGANQFGTGNELCIKFKVTPNYSGSPGSDETFYTHCKTMGVSGNNLLLIRHQGNGGIQLLVRDSTGGLIFNYESGAGAWSPTSGTKYEFSFNCNFTTGESRLFIQGNQHGTTQTGTGTIDKTEIDDIRIGSNYGGTDTSNFSIEDFMIFETVQHTSNYTAGYTLYDYRYLETSIVLPEMEHTGDGTIKLFNSFSTTEVGSPRYVIEIGRSGDKLYWTGSAWAISDETYAQSNDVTTFNTNCGSLPVDGEKYGQFTIIFPDSNTISSVSSVTANMNVDIGYLTTNPSLLINSTFRHEALEGFFETATKSGSDEIKYILKKGTSFYWWSGSAWAVSDGTYAQSNTAAEIYANRATFTTEIVVTQIKVFLHSDDGSTTPEITNLEVQYDFAGETPDTINTCIVWGLAVTMEGSPITDTITVTLNKESIQYKTNTVIRSTKVTITPNSATGYWEIGLIETENMESTARYVFDFGGDRYERQVPDEQDKKFWDLVA